jgi:molybdopterin/thiamine biosynthesis adenylyltransferase
MISEDFYRESFKRNIGLVNESEQQRLGSARVAIAGLGGVGGIHLATLARIGIGKFSIADNDTFEAANLNRQYGATIDTMGKSKVDVMAGIARSINPAVQVSTFPDGVHEGNIDAFLSGVDLVVDGIDFFSVDARRLLFNRARQNGIYAVTSGPIGFGATLQVFSPAGMSFDAYFGINDGMSYIEKMVAFTVGLTPWPLHLKYMDLTKVNLATGTGPSFASACDLCASLVTTTAVDIILGRRPVKSVPHYFQFDPYRRVYRKGYLAFGGRNPLQALKRRILMKRIGPLLKRMEKDADTGSTP